MNEYLVTIRCILNGKEADVRVFADTKQEASCEALAEYVVTYGGYYEDLEVTSIEVEDN